MHALRGSLLALLGLAVLVALDAVSLRGVVAALALGLAADLLLGRAAAPRRRA